MCFISEHQEICAAFNEHVSSAGNLFDETDTGPPLSTIDPVTQIMTTPPFSLQPFSFDEVADALLSMDSQISVGEDKLEADFLKLAAPVVVCYMTHILKLSVKAQSWGLSCSHFISMI